MKAKISNYTLQLTKAGKPCVAIKFACEDGKTRSWWGSLNEGKAREITIDTLLRCGFKGEDVLEVGGGLESNVLDVTKELALTIEDEKGLDGKTREKVRWVNEVGGEGFKNAMTKDDAVKMFSGMNLKAEVAARRQVTGFKKPEATDEDVPF